MATSWKIASSVLYLMFLVALGSTISVPSPPTIIRHPNPEITIKPGDDVEIPCIATGEPSPLYTWKKNDQPLAIDNIFIKQLPGLGTIVLESVHRSYRGVYQCIATNNFGSALSIKTILNMAVLEPFPSLKEPKIHRPIVGMPLTLHCQPPLSYPQSIVYWGESRDEDRLKPIDGTDRISLDYEGNLYFANVLAEDAKGGSSYICVVQNMELRSLVQGDNQKIDPQPISGAPRYEAPKLMWPLSNAHEVALKGETKKMKCIFSGYPTPSVNWTRVDAPLPSKVIINSYGKEITIPDVDYSDVGSYRCTGTNDVSETSRTVTLRVESPPYWKDNKPPEDVNTSEEEYARFDCQAIGQPKPEIAWFSNGMPVQDLPPDPRRSITREYLVYRNVTKSDAQVIQCNASNVHGYVFANAFLNVLAELPSFIDAPQAVVKVAEGQNVTLTCQVFGAPKPVITWKKTDIGSTAPSKPVIGDRFILENSGNLRILNAKTEDEGTYYCVANNKFGQDEAKGNLLVRNRTKITEVPVPQTVNASTNVILHCSATTDTEEKRKLKVDWLKNNEKIDFNSGISKNTVNNALIITQAQVSDSGNYTCNASNGLDSDSVTVKVTVKGAPRYEAPKLMWPLSNAHEVALKGETKKMKCIFSGYPTPSVNWTRVDAPLPSKVIINSYGKEITIPDVDYSDVGSYRCTGTNDVSETSRTVTLRVESRPYWKSGIPPEDIHASMGDGARFDCQAIGQPKPKITWFINGIPVQELPLDPRRSITGDSLVYRNVTMRDVQVIQCNASNVHGYVFANAILNVIDVKPNMLPTGWIIGIIVCAIAFLLLILVLIFLIKRNCGGRNKAHKRNLKGHDSTKTDDETGFGEYTRTGNVNKS